MDLLALFTFEGGISDSKSVPPIFFFFFLTLTLQMHIYFVQIPKYFEFQHLLYELKLMTHKATDTT